MATKNGGGGGAHVSASETSFAYGLLSPVVYIFRSVDRPSLSSCFDHPAAHPRKVLHVHRSSLSIYYAIVAWFRYLFVWVMLELGFMILAGDVPMDLVSFCSTFATSSGIYIALA